MSRRPIKVRWTPEDSKVLHLLASVMSGQGRDEKAAVLLECVKQNDPNYNEAPRALSGVYLRLERYEEAIKMADDALSDAELDQQFRVALLFIRSHALWALGRSDDARAAMNDYIEARKHP